MTAATPETGRDAHSARGRANRRKGADAERAVARWLRANGFPGAERAVRAAYVGSDRVIPDPGDLTGTPGIVWQVKDCRREQISTWLYETEKQRVDARADHGMLIQRRPGKADVGKWWCWLPLAKLLDLAAEEHLFGDKELGEHPVRLELGDVARLLRIRAYGTEPAVVL